MSGETRIVPICPFCNEEEVDIIHVQECSVRHAQIICEREGLPDFSAMFGKLAKLKTLCNELEHAEDALKDHSWCCHDCFTFGQGDLPNECPDCHSFSTSPARIFLEENASS